MDQRPLKIIINPDTDATYADNLNLSNNTNNTSDSQQSMRIFTVILRTLTGIIKLPAKLLIAIVQATIADLIKTIFSSFLFVTLLLMTIKHTTPRQLPNEINTLFKNLTASIQHNKTSLKDLTALLDSTLSNLKGETNKTDDATNAHNLLELLTDKTQVLINFDTKPPSTFYCEVARSDSKKQIGLMHRSKIPENYCMLFVFDTPVLIPFWMKNVEIPLDIIFLDSGMHIIQIYHDLPPCSKDVCPAYAPDKQFQYVIEIKGGISPKLGISKDTTLDIKILQ